MIKAIFAADKNWGIGKNNDLPWPHNSDDLKWFKECTVRQMVIMGRKTWESLPVHPLPSRHNVVVTSQPNDIAPGASNIYGYQEFREQISDLKPYKEKWIIGGAEFLLSTLDMISELHISRIDGDYDCDTFLPVKVITDNFVLDSTTTLESLTIEIWIKK